MSVPDPATVDRRIEELTVAIVAQTPGTAEYRASRVELATYLFTRFSRGGPAADGVAAEEICREVLADPEATEQQRQNVGLMMPVLAMLSLFRPGAAPPAPSLERSERLREVTEQAAAVPGAESLPPSVRSVMTVLGGFADVAASAQDTDWDERLTPEQESRLSAALEQAPDLPGREIVTAALALLGGSDADATSRLGAALGALPDDHLLAPVLRLDLARALADRPETASPATLARMVDLLERARDGLPAGDPHRAEAVRSLTGVLLATAAHDPSVERLAQVEQAAADLLAAPRGDTPAERGPAIFLGALVDLLRSIVEGDREAVAATRGLTEAIAVLPADHPLRPVAIGQVAALVADRSLREGRLADAHAADRLFDDLIRAAAVQADDELAVYLRCVAGICRVAAAMRRDDPAALGSGAVVLRAGLARLPEHHLLRPHVELVAALAELSAAARAGDPVLLWQAVRATRQVLEGAPLAGVPAATSRALAGTLDVLLGRLGSDTTVVVAAIDRMESELPTDVVVNDQRIARRVLLALALLTAHDAGMPVEGAADRAVEHLTVALRLLGDRRPGVQRHEILRTLGRAHRARGDREQSCAAAFAALEALAGVVLLQSGVGHAVVAARGASADAAVLARWCLADGDPTGSVRAMELGRGCALHAHGSAARVPDLLRAAKRPDLAAGWERLTEPGSPGVGLDPVAAGLGTGDLPDDLPYRVLDVLRATPGCALLFTAPGPADTGAALRRIGADALVYLLPGDLSGDEGGYLLVVGRDDDVEVVPAPRLRLTPDGPAARFVRALAVDADPLERHAATGQVCAWAGPAVLVPLLTAVRRSRPGAAPPRLVLVPTGVLGAIPWAGARLPGGSPRRPRYACHEAVLSTAASARQLVDVASRAAPRDGGTVALVGDPTGSMPGATDEVLALRAAHHPGAVLLGVPGGAAGTPEEVLALLPGPGRPGVGLVHLAGHAVTADTVEESRLVLTASLPVRRVLDRAPNRSIGIPGPAVVLAGCSTDLTERDYDEALTLATAFLSAGAVAVVGSRWEVLDRYVGVLMFAFHHHLRATGGRAADALRAAQLWMIDPDRDPLPGMPDDMRRRSRSGLLTDVVVWAAFAHHGW